MYNLTSDEQFFYDNAGYCYNPKTETADEGRVRCAKNLTAAEQFALREGFTFHWEEDDIDSTFYNDAEPAHPLFVCVMRDSVGTVRQSLGGVDLLSWNDPYMRVVRAELAAEEMPELDDVVVLGNTD